jgi:TPR repeat protein
MRTLAAVSACGLLVLVRPITLTTQSTPPAQSASEIQVVRAAAESGDAVAQHKLGMAYATGEGVPQNDAQAAAWFRKAADQGFARQREVS